MRCFAWLALFLVAPLAWGQSRDIVYYLDRTSKSDKPAAFEGSVVEESINGVRVKPANGTERTFGTLDLVDIAYAPPRSLELKFQTITLAEAAVRTGTADRPRMQQLLREYLAIVEPLREARAASLRRHVAYRIACLKAQLAESADEIQEAVRDFSRLRTELLESWQLIPAARWHAQLLIDLGRTAEALEVLDAASRTPRLSVDIKRDLGLHVIDLMLRCEKHRDAEARIADELAELPADHPSVPLLNLYRIAAVGWTASLEETAAKLKQAVDTAETPVVKAVGYNLLGHLFSSKKQFEDAMWSYLWVDVVYSQDRREHVKALERLVNVFTELKDESRAEKYREKLRAARQ
ncbi:MAG: hypothetical protein N2039_06190 [Gemmataceae bacterium]|nr:hypothetical protein [Gemmataceae bacterium]